MTSLQRRTFLAAWTFAALVSTSLFAQSGPVIPGYQQYHRQASDAAGGELLLSELNCVACHAESNVQLGNLAPKSAPELSNVGSRVRPEYLRDYLKAPHQQKPGATMPDVLGGLPADEREEAIENLTHFLASSGRVQEGRKRTREVRDGKALYHEVGCVACHGPREGSAANLPQLKPLGKLEAKYSVPSLTTFLQDPLKVRPSGRMPSLRLSSADANKIAQYLLQDLDVEIPANLQYAYYEEANLGQLPDFSKLTPKETGEAMSFDLGLAQRRDNFALVFEGFLNIGQEGEYTFHLDSDDGSRIEIDGQQVAINDGIHPKQRRSGKIRLKPGMHELRVEYFEGAGEEAFEVTFDGPGGIRNAYVADHVFLKKEETSGDGEKSFQVNPQRADKGRIQFVSLGCASCHSMSNVKADPMVLQGPGLADLDTAKGCLAESPAKVPNYQLTEGQRHSLAAAIAHRKQSDLQPWEPEQQVRRHLATFNCYACHQRDDIGGVNPELNVFFHTTQAEMGDEGRIPPTLHGVGAKLSPTWMKKVLSEGAKDRPYMQTVMPNFGYANVGGLAPLFASLDTLPAHPPIEIPETEGRIKATGRHMVGDKVFGCIKCHTFAGEKASGVQGIDMTLMTRRLNHDWFLAYVMDPPRFRKGTRMPTAWPNGKSVMRNILGGDADQQVEAIWRYLQDGKEAAKPFGVGQQTIELVAWRKAVIYRNFIEGAGSRAIGIGFPEKANLAFDAANMNLAMIWQGSFIDASRHWTGRGQGFQPPLGDNVIHLPGGAPWAVLRDPSAKWPETSGKEAGYQFLGYRLDELNNPTFRYRLHDLTVSEAYHAEKEGEFPSLIRTITVDGHAPEGKLLFRALAGANIHPLEDGWYQLGDGLKLQVTGANAIIRNGQSDLVVEVPEGAERTFTLTYVW
ncbi:c-type cytochrome [Blastopirellula marina]|uniref:Cytochrome c1 n=1 Tax=Blastopirellula marina TaxID=124 RepID=A0A2S8G0E2_9BACT|nr:c-type cytochrome [Blastopirellula marina]PQO37915.1 cytochrome c1 [Blastopirellula marina]PTL44571.1 cytochrome c1 [Blastopirellula marina]